MRISSAEVGRVLSDWLGQQRWYAGKSRAGSVHARQLATLTEDPHPVQIWIADITYENGDVEHYQVPLVLRAEPAQQLDHVFVGAVLDEDGESAVHLYDALHDKDVTGAWLDALVAEEDVDGLRFVRRGPAADLPVGEPSLALTAEQSNTSIVFGDVAIMKFFRRIESGLNPDIEIHGALTDLGGEHIADLLGHVTAMIDGEPWSLAMLQNFMVTATDGWQLATISVRDLMAEGDLHADEVGGDFASEAHRLGQSTAQVHADLAAAFGTTTLSPDEVRSRVEAMQARLDAALVQVAELAPVAPDLRRIYRELADLGTVVPAQRVHGDLHLGQVLRTARRWILLDFEGEPAKTITERRALDSPLRDVAGMLRSFDYAARYQLSEGEGTSQTEARSKEWAARNRDAYCAGYAEESGTDPHEDGVLLRALEADKAVYEAVYEARNRPSWLPVPLASLRRIAGE